MKRGIKRALYKFIKCDGITAVISIIVIIIVWTKEILINKQEIIDWTIFTSFIVLMVLEKISNSLKALLMNKLEDLAKVEADYEKLSAKYVNKMIVFDNSFSTEKNLRKMRKLKNQTMIVKFPVICDFQFNGCPIEIQDSSEQYVLPEIIQEHFDEIFAAHATSKIYNQLNIRGDSWNFEGGKFVIKTSRTTYFNSLVTNRAIDYQWSNGLTIRDQFEFGPFLHTLEESRLSNHIGFNGFIESMDGYIVFVKRGNKLSIGKGTYGDSIGASLKTKYALNDSKKFTKDGLTNSILHEIQDELKIPKEALEEFSLEKHLIAAYRDVVEGGKPQFLFFIRSSWTKERIEQNFIEHMRKGNKEKDLELLEDGKKFLWISSNEIGELGILPDKIFYKGKKYGMMPSASAAIVMLIEFKKKRG